MQGAGLLLVALGAPRHPAPQAAVAAHAARLREAGGFADAAAAFLAASPGPAEALAGLRGDPVCVVPMFMAEGYLARVALPQALAKAGAGRAGMRLASPLGMAPELTEVIARRALADAREAGFVPQRTGLLLVGHGAEGDPSSREAVGFHAARLAAQRRFARVEIACLEEEPRIATQLAACPGDMVVAGFFAAPGMHASEDVPRALAADPRQRERRLRYGGAIGSEAEVTAIIAALARATLSGLAPRRA
jgi:sirohydrochlorin ferrochelatase